MASQPSEWMMKRGQAPYSTECFALQKLKHSSSVAFVSEKEYKKKTISVNLEKWVGKDFQSTEVLFSTVSFVSTQ